MKSHEKKLIALTAFSAFVILAYILIDRIFSPDRVELARTFYQQGGISSLLMVFHQFPWLKCLGKAGIQWGIVLAIFAAAGYLRPGFEKINSWITSMPRPYFLAAIFIIAFWGTLGIFYFKYQFFPKSGDEGAFLFQVKILRQGHLTVPSHPLREFFDSEYVINNGRMYAEYPLGTSFVLLLGDLLGMPWIINPLLGALGLVFLCLSAEFLYDETIARYGTLFLLCSPWYYSMPSTYLSHAPQFCFLSVFIYCFLQTLQKSPPSTAKQPIIAGLALGMAFNTRPLTAVTFSISLLLWAAYLLIKDCRGFYRRALLFCLGMLPFILTVLIVNYIQNGNPLLFGHKVYNGPRPTLGFSEMYSLRQAISAYFFRLRLILYELTFPPIKTGILLVLIGLSFINYKPQNTLLWAFFVLTSIGYLTVVSSIWQTRYYYSATLYLLLLVPVGISNLGEWMKRHFNTVTAASLLTAFFLFLGASTLGAAYLSGIQPSNWLHTIERPYLVAERHKLNNALVFLRSSKLYYPKWYTRNSPDLNDSVLWVLDLGEHNRELMKYYPERKAYLYDFRGGDTNYYYNYGCGELKEIPRTK